MKFGTVPLAQAEGAILAHSVQAGARKLRKGTVLDAAAIGALREAGIPEVAAARLDPGDVEENEAAVAIARALVPEGAGVRVTPPVNGRANLMAAQPGLYRVDAPLVDAVNALDPGITLATLPDHTRVHEGMMLATVKIIPYSVPGAAVDRALAVLASRRSAMSIAPAVVTEADLILTRTPGFRQSLIGKGEEVIEERMAALGVRLRRVETVPHETAQVAAALARSSAPLVLILSASATSDAADVCPAGLVAAGGTLTRFGMPVDPGNLLFLGRIGARDVVGLPGCARSPALNGADFVLERLVCGLEVGSQDIARMGVGGLLKEIPIRPQPRVIRPTEKGAARVEVILLAAGSGTRMRGADKLLEPVEGVPLIARAAREAAASKAAAVHVVLPPGDTARETALSGVPVRLTVAEAAREGMGASLRAGMQALSPRADAAIVALADMPEVTAGAYDALIAAFDPEHGHEICRAATQEGEPGHPVLFGRRFFESLADVTGDRGARDILRAAPDFVVDVPIGGKAAVTDLDTPEQWAAWRAARAG